MTVQQTASQQIYDCVFDNDINKFKVKTIYEAKGINLTMPECGK